MEVGVNTFIYVNCMMTAGQTIHISVLPISSKEIVVDIFACNSRLAGTGVLPTEVMVDTFTLYSQLSTVLQEYHGCLTSLIY